MNEEPRLPRGIHKHGNRYRVKKAVLGQSIRESFATLEEAIVFLARIEEKAQAEAKRALDHRVGRSTVGALVDDWYAVHSKRLTPGGQLDYEGRIARTIKPLLGEVDVLDLINDRQILHRFYWEQLPPVTAKRTHTILQQVFEYAVLRGRIPVNPAKGQSLPSTKAKEKDIPTPEQVDKIIRAADDEDPLWGLFVRLTATLGTRRGETCALRWEDFDRDRQRVLIRRAVTQSKDVLTLKLPKSGRPRTLHIPYAGFWETLDTFRQPDGFLFVGWTRDPDRRRLLEARGESKPWHPSSVNRKFARTIARLGLRSENDRPFTLHSLRHLVATTLYNQTHDWVQVAKFMGHTSPAMTMELYANHVVEDAQRQLGDLAAAPWWGPDQR